MFAVELDKPDGRRLTLYARQPLRGVAAAPSPFPEPLAGSPVDFLLSDMGQWPAEGQKSRASPARMADDEASRAGPVSLLPDGSEPSFVASALQVELPAPPRTE